MMIAPAWAPTCIRLPGPNLLRGGGGGRISGAVSVVLEIRRFPRQIQGPRRVAPAAKLHRACKAPSSSFREISRSEVYPREFDVPPPPPPVFSLRILDFWQRCGRTAHRHNNGVIWGGSY